MQENDLTAAGAEVFYNQSPMDDAELWRAIGAALAVCREERGWGSVQEVKRARHEAPNERTLAAIELGRTGHVASLSEYCAVLDGRLTDVLRSVLPSADATAEGLQMARAFDLAQPRMKQAVRLLLAPEAPPRRSGGGASGHARTPVRSGQRRQKA